MSSKSPLSQVKDVHGGKEKLVDSLVSLLDRGEESKDEFRARLLSAANSKLLRLHRSASELKQRFGDKEKLVDSLLALKKRGKDQDYREKLLQRTTTQLLSLHRDWEKSAAAG